MNKKFVYLIPLLLLLAGLYFIPMAIFEKNFSKMPGDLGDTRFNNYILEHGHQYITGKAKYFWDASFLYPYKNVVALSDNLIGTLPIYSLFRFFGADRETAFQFWLMTLFALNFIFCFLALNKWSNHLILASVGAYIFAFSIYNLGQINHVQVFPRFIAPLVMYWCWKFISEKNSKYLLFAALGLVYQFYCGIYLAFMLLYILLFACIAYFIVYRDIDFFRQFRNKKFLLSFFSIGILSFVLLLPLIIPYLEVAKVMGMRKFDAALSTIPRLSSYFFATGSSVVWKSLSHHGEGAFPDWWNHYLFIGAIPWMGVIAGIFAFTAKKISTVNKRFLAYLFSGLLLSFIFCLNVKDHTLYHIIFKLPGFSCMRSIDRLINMEVILFILVFVFVFKNFEEEYPKMKYFILFLPLLVVLENRIDPSQVNRFEKQESQARIQHVKKLISEQYSDQYSAIAYMPVQTYLSDPGKGYISIVSTQLDVMLATQELNIPCINSYTGFDPGNYLNFFYDPRDRTLREWCEFSHADYSKILRINDLGKAEKSRRKVCVKAYNGRYLSATEGGEPIIVADREKVDSWETFTIVNLVNGECLLRAETNLFFTIEFDRQGALTASNPKAGERETFRFIELSDSTFAFKAANGKFLSVDPKSLHIYATSPVIGDTEKFSSIEL